MARRSLYIVNPAAGAGRAGKFWARIQRQLQTREGAPRAIVTTKPGEATSIARDAVAAYDRIIAVGGDGTVSEVAEGMLGVAESPCGLGIVPLGTGNDFARTLGLGELQNALQALAHENSRVIDVIEVDGVTNSTELHRHALFFAGTGIIGPVLRMTTQRTKRLLGKAFAYRLGLLRALRNYCSARMRIISDGAAWEGVCLFLGVSNGEHVGGGMRIAPGAHMEDGWLNVNLVGSVGRWEALKQLRNLNQGKHTTHPLVRYFTANNITVEANPVSEVAADGEIIGRTPARFVVKPKALRVVSP